MISSWVLFLELFLCCGTYKKDTRTSVGGHRLEVLLAN